MSAEAIVGRLAEIRASFPAHPRVILGIAGAPGAGKSTIAELLVARLGPTAALLPMDGYHLPRAELVRLGRRVPGRRVVPLVEAEPFTKRMGNGAAGRGAL